MSQFFLAHSLIFFYSYLLSVFTRPNLKLREYSLKCGQIYSVRELVYYTGVLKHSWLICHQRVVWQKETVILPIIAPLVWCQTLSVNHNPLWHYIDSSQKCTPKQSYLSLARQCVIMPNLCVGAIHYVLKGFVINVSSFLHTGWITCWCFFLILVAGSIVTDIVAPSIPFQLKIYIYYEI